MMISEDVIVEGLRALGISDGAVVFVHSSLGSMGNVDGGAATVVEAFARAVGHNGTLVAPTFTFSCRGRTPPIFDPATDPSEVGKITETVRRLPGCRRSLHLTHSVAAIGANASQITRTHGASAFGDDGPLWRLQELDAIICLLGVQYTRCTFFHVLEQHVQVEYRGWHEVAASYKDDSGALRPLPTRVYVPKPGFEGNDFNKLGKILEDRGLVTIGAIGNAVTRCFRARDALETGVAEYRSDPALFLKTTGSPTALDTGHAIGDRHFEKCVVNPKGAYQP